MPVAPNIIDAIRVGREASAGPGRYSALVSGDWAAPVHPSGGVTSAVALHAMQTELDLPGQVLRSFSTMFVSTVPSGPMEITVETLRRGRRMSQLRADVRARGGDGPGHVVTAAFGETREGFEFGYAQAPEAGPPEGYPGFAVPPQGALSFRPPFFEQVEVRRVRMFASFEVDWEGGRAEAIRWIRYREAPRRADGSIEPLSLIALADTMPPAVAQYLGPGHVFFHAPSVDLSMRLFQPPVGDWILTRTVAHWAGDGYASAEITLWDERRRPVGHASQMMLIRFPALEDLQSR
jgi:acyl-CoA thioesterase